MCALFSDTCELFLSITQHSARTNRESKDLDKNSPPIWNTDDIGALPANLPDTYREL